MSLCTTLQPLGAPQEGSEGLPLREAVQLAASQPDEETRVGSWGQRCRSLPVAASLCTGLPAILRKADFPGQQNFLEIDIEIGCFRQQFISPVLAVHFRGGTAFIPTVPAACCFLQVFVVENLEEKPSLYLHKRQLAVTACHEAYTCTRPNDASLRSFFVCFDQENPR